MLNNIYILYKIINIIFFKEYVVRDHCECYFKNIKVVAYTLHNKEFKLWNDKKNIIYSQYSNMYQDSVYIVKPGDTLFYIAWITGDNYINLAKKNNIKNIHVLKINQILKIKRNFIRSLFYKNISRKILLSCYKNRYKINKLFFLFKKNKTTSSIPGIENISCYCSKKIDVNLLHTWHWPAYGLVVKTFSESDGGNKGIDISGVLDQPILATTNGRVVYVGNVLKGYGNLVIIKHDNNYLSAYAHNNQILVTEKQQVKTGDQIATMGSSGTNAVKLHFEIRYKDKSVNPLNLLP